MIDLAIFQPQLNSQPAIQELATADNSGQTVTGMAKLVQRIMLELMTTLNSIPQSTAGCEFVTRLLTGKVSSELDVFLAFTSSIGTVVKHIQAAQLTTDPPTEILTNIKILQLVVSTDTVALNLQITNSSGQKEQITLPLNFLLT